MTNIGSTDPITRASLAKAAGLPELARGSEAEVWSLRLRGTGLDAFDEKFLYDMVLPALASDHQESVRSASFALSQALIDTTRGASAVLISRIDSYLRAKGKDWDATDVVLRTTAVGQLRGQMSDVTMSAVPGLDVARMFGQDAAAAIMAGKLNSDEALAFIRERRDAMKEGAHSDAASSVSGDVASEAVAILMTAMSTAGNEEPTGELVTYLIGQENELAAKMREMRTAMAENMTEMTRAAAGALNGGTGLSHLRGGMTAPAGMKAVPSKDYAELNEHLSEEAVRGLRELIGDPDPSMSTKEMKELLEPGLQEYRAMSSSAPDTEIDSLIVEREYEMLSDLLPRGDKLKWSMHIQSEGRDKLSDAERLEELKRWINDSDD